MNKIRFLFGTLLVAALLFGSLVTARAADPVPPPFPSSFYGEVHYVSGDGILPGVGDNVEAYVPGPAGSIASKGIVLDTPNLVYAINVPGDNPNTPAKDGGLENDVVTFKINGRVVGTGIWHGGTNVRLNIHPPKADAGGPYVVLVNGTVNLSGSASDWLTTGETATYAWNLDGDGIYETPGQTTTKTYTTAGTRTVGLQVTDSKGGVGTATADVVVVGISGIDSWVYDGTAHTATVTGVGSSYTYTVKYWSGGSILGSAPKDAGDYKVLVEVFSGSTSVGLVEKPYTISSVAITVAADAKSKVYGAVDPALTYQITSGALVGVESLSGSLIRDLGETVGIYTIKQGGLSGGANYAITYISANLTIIKADTVTTLVCAPDPVAAFSASTCTVTVSATGVTPGGTVSFSKDAGDAGSFSASTCTLISGSCSVTYTPSAVGDATHRITATYGGTGNFNGSNGFDDLGVSKANQTITVTTHAPATADYDSTFTVAATASSTLSVAYSSGSPTICTVVSGATFKIIANAGTCKVQYDQAGNSDYNAAPQVVENVSVNQAPQFITVTTPAPTTAVYGSSFTVAATATSGLVVAYSSGDDTICTNSGATFTMVSGTGTCKVQFDQAGNANYLQATQIVQDVTADKKAASVTPNANSKSFGAADPSPLTTGNLIGFLAGDGISASYSRVAGEAIGTYTISATLAPSGKLGNYTITYNTALFTINPIQQSINLVAGWNLVSFNLVPYPSTAIADVLASLGTNYDLVYAWDASGAHSVSSGNWIKYARTTPAGATLTNLTQAQGFWINMTAPATLVVSGSYATTSIQLLTGAGGWNLVGFPSEAGVALPGALSVLGTDYSLVFAYHADEITTDPWKLFDRAIEATASYANDLRSMAPGWGYWIKVSADRTLSVNYK